MTVKLGVVMDPIEKIKPWKDTSFAILLSAQQRDWVCEYIKPDDLYWNGTETRAISHRISVSDQNQDFYQTQPPRDIALTELDLVIQRQDPPVDLNYQYVTALLALAEQQGLVVANRPNALRASNEKLLAQQYPQFCPPSLVSRKPNEVKAFLQVHEQIIVKPLDAMGGAGIFKLTTDDPNTDSVLEMLTCSSEQLIMAQRFIPEISTGDKRVLLIDGEPFSHALLRTPGENSVRANLAAGGKGTVVPIDDRDREIAAAIGPELAARGFWFVGLDIIGGFLTEVNVTSPTCAREIHAATGVDVTGKLLDVLANK